MLATPVLDSYLHCLAVPMGGKGVAVEGLLLLVPRGRVKDGSCCGASWVDDVIALANAGRHGATDSLENSSRNLLTLDYQTLNRSD